MSHFSPENFQTCTIGLLLGRAALLKDRILDSHRKPTASLPPSSRC